MNRSSLPAQDEPTDGDEIIRVTLSLPKSLLDLLDEAAKDPRYAGNRSAILRAWIIDNADNAKKEVPAH